MTLRAKTLVILGGTMLALVLALCYVSFRIVSGTFADLERTQVERDTAQVVAAVDTRGREIGRSVSDWAHWDDTWRFAREGNLEYVHDNLSADTLSGLDLDFMAFLDARGKVVEIIYARSGSAVLTEPPRGLTAFLVSDRPMLTSPPVRTPSGGIVDIAGQGPALVMAQAIRKSDFSGPTAGTLVAGVLLDSEEEHRLSQAANVPVTISAPSAPLLGRLGLTSDGDVRVMIASSERVEGHVLLGSVDGRSGAVASVSLPRDLRAKGNQTLVLLATLLVIVGVSAMVVVMMFLEITVLAPVMRLSARVGQIGRSGDTSQRVWIYSRDELGALGSSINSMLVDLHESEAELRAARVTLEERVEERTAELERTVEALRTEVAERRRAEEALRESEQRYRALVQSMADAVFTLDREGRFTFVNTRAEALTGYTSEQLVGRQLYEILTADSSAVMRRRFRRPSSLRSESVELELIDSRGKLVPVELSLASLLGADGESAGVQGVARDITERKRFEAELMYVATHDHLTGLFNRRRFEEELERELAESRRHDRRGAIIWLDLDHFKDINDGLGHRAGDEVLIALSEALRSRVRDQDVLSRLGGDEFAVLMPACDGREAQIAARRLLEELRSQAIVVSGHAIRLSASVGIVLYPDHGTSVDELLARADLAMYHAKEGGRNRFSVYLASDEWHSELAARRTWAERIEEALARDLLVVHAQPIVDLETMKPSRFELLVRMKAEDGSLVPPDQFLPAAERLGLINDIDRWMLSQAVALISERLEHGERLRLDLNLSARALSDPDFLRVVQDELETSRIDPALLGMEITETAVIADIGRAQDFVQRLKEMGCRFSLDDFGSGFSSFYHLKHLPIDHLKIDGTFIQRLPENAADQHLVRGMVELSRGLGMRTTAEYVENAETLGLLRAYGVDYAQGYFLGMPGPASEVLQGRFARLE